VGALEPFTKLPDLSDLLAHPNSFVTPAASPDVRAAFQAIIDAGIELEKRQKASMEITREARSIGFPSTGGGMGMAPFDVMSDLLRGTRGIIMDMYRQPDKLHEAMDKVADLMIARGKETAKNINALVMTFPLHKGDDTFMSDEQFETFYWPSLRKVVMAFIEEGLMVSLFAEGRYNNRLKHITDLPKGWVNWAFDKTDMKKAKEILGGICCISGNIPSSLMATGTPQEVKEYCCKLIEYCAPGGGYVLSGGASVTETNAENLRVIMEASREYGVY
jgi:uroporphyrinogen-III decarboxylase